MNGAPPPPNYSSHGIAVGGYPMHQNIIDPMQQIIHKTHSVAPNYSSNDIVAAHNPSGAGYHGDPNMNAMMMVNGGIPKCDAGNQYDYNVDIPCKYPPSYIPPNASFVYHPEIVNETHIFHHGHPPSSVPYHNEYPAPLPPPIPSPYAHHRIIPHYNAPNYAISARYDPYPPTTPHSYPPTDPRHAATTNSAPPNTAFTSDGSKPNAAPPNVPRTPNEEPSEQQIFAEVFEQKTMSALSLVY